MPTDDLKYTPPKWLQEALHLKEKTSATILSDGAKKKLLKKKLKKKPDRLVGMRSGQKYTNTQLRRLF